MEPTTSSGEQKKHIIACKDFNSAYYSLTSGVANEDEEEVYEVQIKDVDCTFMIWRENNELKSKFQGNLFHIIYRDSYSGQLPLITTKTLIKLKSSPSFVRYDCVDELNALVLHLVCYHGIAEFVEDFISPENCRQPGNFLYTPLHYACMNPFNIGNMKTVQEIIKVAGPEACADKSLHGYCPIDYTHNDEVVQYLQELETQI